MEFNIRAMEIGDYAFVFDLWSSINGFGIRSVDDSEDGLARFLGRNPSTSIVAEMNGKIVGSVLCGHDGRTATFYHVCVREDYREHGIGRAMVSSAIQALREEKINKVNLIAYKDNEIGNHFWSSEGWNRRDDLNYFDLSLNDGNIIHFNE